MQSKLPNVGTTIFTEVSSLATKYRAINLGQGFPDFDPDPVLLECVHKSIVDSTHQYAPMAGFIPLKEILGAHHNIASNCLESHITVTAGGTQAIFTAITAFIRKGDEVIVFEPVYDCYIPAIELNGGTPIIITSYPPSFEINWSKVEEAITEFTRMIIINTPCNPSGKMWSDEDYHQLSRLVLGKPIIILADEVYEDIILGNNRHISPRDIESIANQTVSVHSLGKVLGCTGWKIGYIIANEKLNVEFRKVHQFNVFSVNSFLQAAIASYFEQKPNARSSLRNLYTKKYELMLSSFNATLLTPLMPDGGFFQIFNYDNFGNENDKIFNDQLIHSVRVAGIPLSAFYPSGTIKNGYIRFCFAKKDDTILAASDALKKYLIR